MTLHMRTEEFKPNRTALPRRLVGRRPAHQSRPARVDLDYVSTDGITLLNTAAALAEHAKNVATPHKFEVGDLVDLHIASRGHFDAIVLDRHLLAPGPNGGRAVTLLVIDGGPRIMALSEERLELLERGYLAKSEVELYL
ncbi:hypothetical protein [Rhizobium mongolense]|uniref:Uncharacterized protein n=1 Tax=Rhizobium mongolense TaxID=57676 RepID=A0A7W6WCB4_9HYPH|nr:hypothetical protein [Rhizobium mongolense]MBB4272826.1 hypothetical protein [Rhizobium mongolense]